MTIYHSAMCTGYLLTSRGLLNCSCNVIIPSLHIPILNLILRLELVNKFVVSMVVVGVFESIVMIIVGPT